MNITRKHDIVVAILSSINGHSRVTRTSGQLTDQVIVHTLLNSDGFLFDPEKNDSHALLLVGFIARKTQFFSAEVWVSAGNAIADGNIDKLFEIAGRLI